MPTQALPNAPLAVIALAKLRDYCLNPDHPEGKHKARVFAAALGLGREDAQALRLAILQAVQTANATQGLTDQWGERYTVDVVVENGGRLATVRTA